MTMELNKQEILDNQYVIFKLAEESYGIAIGHVKLIEKPSQFTRVPNAPDYVKGVINLRGEVITVLDLRKRFELSEMEDDSNARIIILNFEELVIGFYVDASSEVLEINQEDIDNPPSTTNSEKENFISGVGKNDGRLILLLDLEKVLGLHEKA